MAKILDVHYTKGVITAWQSYTPTFQGFGTPSAVEFQWRQVGQNVEIRGKFTSGTSTTVEARIGLPAGLSSAGTGIIPSIQIIGKCNVSLTSSTYFGGVRVLAEPSVTYLTLGVETSTVSGTAKSNGDSIVGTSGIVTFFASVPCSGLSATT